MRYDELLPMDTNRLIYVLVTPKAVALKPGGLVDVAGTPCHIQLAHTLDPYKNEYEIVKTVDL